MDLQVRGPVQVKSRKKKKKDERKRHKNERNDPPKDPRWNVNKINYKILFKNNSIFTYIELRSRVSEKCFTVEDSW